MPYRLPAKHAKGRQRLHTNAEGKAIRRLLFSFLAKSMYLFKQQQEIRFVYTPFAQPPAFLYISRFSAAGVANPLRSNESVLFRALLSSLRCW